MIDDNEYKYRVTLLCECQTDAAFGRAPTVERAREIAETEFKQHHGSRTRYVQVLTEIAVANVNGGWHYEEQSMALHFEFPDGLGSELDALGRERGGKINSGDLLAWEDAYKIHRPNHRYPYVYESSDPCAHRALTWALTYAASCTEGRGNGQIKLAARKAYALVHRLVKHVAPEALSSSPLDPKGSALACSAK